VPSYHQYEGFSLFVGIASPLPKARYIFFREPLFKNEGIDMSLSSMQIVNCKRDCCFCLLLGVVLFGCSNSYDHHPLDEDWNSDIVTHSDIDSDKYVDIDVDVDTDTDVDTDADTDADTDSDNDWVVPDNPNDGEGCAKFSATAEQTEIQVEKEVPVEVKVPLPVSVYIMLDVSASMLIPDSTLLPKSVTATDSINAFVNDPNSAGISVAFGAFPIANAACEGAAYENPVVPMGPLPDNAAAISNGLALALPFNNTTPTEPALLGATRYCAQYKRDPVANPEGEDCVVIFITDGLPAECNTDAAYLAGIARDAYNNDGVTTFAIGMFGADFTMLNQLAEAGQGPHDCHPDNDLLYACDVSDSNMSLQQALELIRSYIVKEEIQIVYETVTETEVLDCEWEIPPPPPDEEFDEDQVNVEFSPTGQEVDKITIPRAENAEACQNNIAWQYSADKKRIVACPPACSMIQAAELGKIDIVLGCEVIVILV
jgi:hypothetical protein